MVGVVLYTTISQVAAIYVLIFLDIHASIETLKSQPCAVISKFVVDYVNI